MDGQRFDELAKQLAGSFPRRTVLRALGAAVGGLLVNGRPGPASGVAASCDGGSCPPCQGCDPASGACVPANEGGPCDDGNACTRDDVCIQGVCVGRDHVVCPGAANQCKTQGTCDPATGRCNTGGNVADGTPCNDADPCSLNSTCRAGRCVGAVYVLTCDKGFVCIKDVNGQFVCARKNDVKAIDQHPG
jgi:hypothetical protein